MKSVALKIALITGELGALSKDGKNEHSNFDFISYEHFYEVLRPLLAKHKLAMIPNITGYEETYQKVMAYDKYKKVDVEKQLIRTVLKGTEIAVCGDTGEMIEFGAVGGDQDYGGKSMSQAYTEFDKRALMKVFKVSSRGDVDPDTKIIDPEKKPEEQPKTENKTKEDTKPPKEKPAKSLIDEDIEKAMKVAGVDKKRLLELVDENFKKKYGDLTTTEKQSLIAIIKLQAEKPAEV